MDVPLQLLQVVTDSLYYVIEWSSRENLIQDVAEEGEAVYPLSFLLSLSPFLFHLLSALLCQLTPVPTHDIQTLQLAVLNKLPITLLNGHSCIPNFQSHDYHMTTPLIVGSFASLFLP